MNMPPCSQKPPTPPSPKESHLQRVSSHLRAQSDSLGVIFLVALVVILVAAIGFFVLDLSDDEGEDLVVTSVESELTPEEFTIRHGGGETLDPENVEVVIEQDGERVASTTLSTVSDPPEDPNRFGGGNRWTHDIGLVTGQVRLVVVHGPTNTRLHERREEFTLTAEGITLSVNGSTNSTTAVGADDPIDITDVQVPYTVEATFKDGYSGPVTVRATLDTPALLDIAEPGLLTAGSPGESPETVTVTATYRNQTSNAVEVTVQPGQGNYSVAIEKITTEGMTARIDYNVTNIGKLTGEQDIELLVGNETINATAVREDLVLGPRETFEGEFQYDISGSTTPVNFTVRSSNESSSQILPVSQRLLYGISSPPNISIHHGMNWSEQNTVSTEEQVSALDISPKGDLLVTGGQNSLNRDVVGIRNTTDWSVERELDVGKKVRHIEWSSNGDYFAVAIGIEGFPIIPSPPQYHLLVFEAETGDQLKRIPIRGHQRVNALEWSPDGTMLAVGAANHTLDGAIRVYDTDSWDRTEVYETRDRVTSLSWSPDGSRLAAGAVALPDLSAENTGTLTILREDSWSVSQNVSVSNPVRSVSWSPDGEIIAHGNGETPVLREPEDLAITETLPEMENSVRSLTWSKWSSYLALADRGAISVYRASNWSPATSFSVSGQFTGPLFQPVNVEESQ